MSNYSDLLKHPKWQKKRLEILQRDDFSCHLCGDGENTLHVHHLFYNKGKKPWEYHNSNLITLCEECHSCEHEIEPSFKDYDFYFALKSCGLLNKTINLIIPGLYDIMDEYSPMQKDIILESFFLYLYKKKPTISDILGIFNDRADI